MKKKKQEIELSEFAGDTEKDSDDNENEQSNDMVGQVQSPSFTKAIEVTALAREWFQSLNGKQKMFCYSFCKFYWHGIAYLRVFR